MARVNLSVSLDLEQLRAILLTLDAAGARPARRRQRPAKGAPSLDKRERVERAREAILADLRAAGGRPVHRDDLERAGAGAAHGRNATREALRALSAGAPVARWREGFTLAEA